MKHHRRTPKPFQREHRDLGPKRQWNEYDHAMSSGMARLVDADRLQHQEAHRRMIDRPNDTSILDRDAQVAGDIYVIDKYAVHAKEIVGPGAYNKLELTVEKGPKLEVLKRSFKSIFGGAWGRGLQDQRDARPRQHTSVQTFLRDKSKDKY
jgi:hypothetical protein